MYVCLVVGVVATARRRWWFGQVIIVDPATGTPRGELEVGEIWVDSPSKARGYWRMEEKTQTDFLAQLHREAHDVIGSSSSGGGAGSGTGGGDSSDKGGVLVAAAATAAMPAAPAAAGAAASSSKCYLRSGDLGFIFKNELFVCGRMKDLIIVRGRNHCT